MVSVVPSAGGCGAVSSCGTLSRVQQQGLPFSCFFLGFFVGFSWWLGTVRDMMFDVCGAHAEPRATRPS